MSPDFDLSNCVRKRSMSGSIRVNAGREAECRHLERCYASTVFPLMRVGVCRCLGSGPVSHQGALRARGAENLPQLPRDAANSESLCRRAYERKTLRGLGFQIAPDCLHTAEVGGSIPPAPTGRNPLRTEGFRHSRASIAGPSLMRRPRAATGYRRQTGRLPGAAVQPIRGFRLQRSDSSEYRWGPAHP